MRPEGGGNATAAGWLGDCRAHSRHGLDDLDEVEGLLETQPASLNRGRHVLCDRLDAFSRNQYLLQTQKENERTPPVFLETQTRKLA